MLAEVLQKQPSFKLSRVHRIIAVTDCRSFYDILVSENPRTEDKRTIVVVRGMQQFVGREDIFWVPTTLQWADALTKLNDKLLETFVGWLYRPWIQLRDAAKAHLTQQSIGNVKFSQDPKRNPST